MKLKSPAIHKIQILHFIKLTQHLIKIADELGCTYLLPVEIPVKTYT